MIHDDTYERALEPFEIEERKNKALELLEEFDSLGSTIDQHQRQIRTLKLRQSTLNSRVRLLRHEVRSGKTLVDRQSELAFPRPDGAVNGKADGTELDGMIDRLTKVVDRAKAVSEYPPFPSHTVVDSDDPRERGIDGMSDEPDPETDPPEHDKPELPDLFAQMFPIARTMPDLWTELVGWALTAEHAAHLMDKPLPPVGTPGFDKIAHWARTTHAHRDGQQRSARGEPGIGGLYIPAIPPVPPELAALLKPDKKKRGARPFSSPSPGLPVTPPAKKTRKRRSGSTQHSG